MKNLWVLALILSAPCAFADANSDLTLHEKEELAQLHQMQNEASDISDQIRVDRSDMKELKNPDQTRFARTVINDNQAEIREVKKEEAHTVDPLERMTMNYQISEDSKRILNQKRTLAGPKADAAEILVLKAQLTEKENQIEKQRRALIEELYARNQADRTAAESHLFADMQSKLGASKALESSRQFAKEKKLEFTLDSTENQLLGLLTQPRDASTAKEATRYLAAVTQSLASSTGHPGVQEQKAEKYNPGFTESAKDAASGVASGNGNGK